MSDHDLPGVRTTEIVDRIADAFFALDRRWRFTYLNDRAEEMLDRSREELIGQVIWDEFPETVETQFPEGFHRAMDTQEPVAFEVYHRPVDAWFEARAYPSETGLTVSLREVTERKERQRDLAQYETIVESVHDGVFTVDADGTITFANDAVETTLGIERDSLVGDHLERLPESASIGPEDAADLGHAIDQVRRGDADDRRLELRYADREGRDRVAEVRLVPVGDGEIAAVVRDVTEHREFERVVTSLHSITPELLDADGDLEICSIAVHAAGEVLDLKISGIWLLDEEYNRLDPVAATAGAHEEVGGLPHFPQGEGIVWEAYRRNEPALYDDVHDLDRHDARTPLRSEIVVPIGDHGVLMAGETTPGALDETDLELATILAANTEAALDRADRDRLLRQSRDTLERQNERLEVVETVLSEDLRDQLAIAARQAQSAGADDAIEPLMRARRLADDALELARGERSVGPRGPIEVGEVVTTAAEIVDGVEVTVRDGAWLRADRDRVVRLFETLLLDARDRAREAANVDAGARDDDGADDDGADFDRAPPDPIDPDGEVDPVDPDATTVTVEVGLVDEATIYVADDAPPIPGDERDDAFDLCHESDGPAAVVDPDDSGPPGLGLAVAGEIAVAHGWEIGVVEVDDRADPDSTAPGAGIADPADRPDPAASADGPAEGDGAEGETESTDRLDVETRVEISDLTTMEPAE